MGLRDRSNAESQEMPLTSVRALRSAVESHALETFGDKSKANHWLNRPNHLFGGRTPVQVLETDPETVEDELTRIDHGIFA
jgi:putative toxin-antitoxin system antitoxin component (TIGR02293 family)